MGFLGDGLRAPLESGDWIDFDLLREEVVEADMPRIAARWKWLARVGGQCRSRC
jgi:hypothetical protein